MSRIRLGRLAKRRLWRISYLQKLEESIRGIPGKDTDRALAFIAIEALNVWTQFCRDFVIASAKGAITASGNPVSSLLPCARNTNQLLIELCRNHGRGRRNGRGAGRHRRAATPPSGLNEPLWRDLGILTRCCTFLGLANVASVHLAASYSPLFVRELPKVRNYAAHRCKETADELKGILLNYGIAQRPQLSVVMQARGPTGSPTLASEWLAEIDLMASTMVQ